MLGCWGWGGTKNCSGMVVVVVVVNVRAARPLPVRWCPQCAAAGCRGDFSTEGSNALRCTALHCVAPHYTALHCTALVPPSIYPCFCLLSNLEGSCNMNETIRCSALALALVPA